MNLSLYLLKAPIQEGIRVSGRTCHAFLTSVLDRSEPSTLLPCRLAPGERASYQYFIIRWTCGLNSRAGHLEEENNSLLMFGIEPRIIGRLACSPVTIQVTLA